MDSKVGQKSVKLKSEMKTKASKFQLPTIKKEEKKNPLQLLNVY